MKTKIAIITTEFLKDFVENAFPEFQLEIEIKVYIYHTFSEIKSIYEAIPEEYEGVITSGSFPAAILHKCFPDTTRLITFFNSDDAGICRLFLRLFLENGTIDLSRVYADFVEVFGISLNEYLTHDPKISYTNLVDPKVSDMTLEALYAIEEQQLQKHLRLFREGKTDLSVTRFSSILPALRDAGLRVYFPHPGMEYLRTITEKLLQDLSIRHLESTRPAVINISVQTPDTERQQDASFQLRCLDLQKALLDFQGSSMLDYILQRTNNGFEMLTDQKTLTVYTENFTSCRLQDFLMRRLDFSVSIGYGIGTDLYQARINAMHAEREASLTPSASYVINEKGILTGPLGRPESMQVDTGISSYVKDIASAAALSPLTVSKVLSVFRAMPEGQLTSADLSNKLSITKRSANRFLTALESSGAVHVVAERRASTKGRPERVYQLHHYE